ncbi:MAG: transketolase [Deltaproteobacteria bacterium]|nr:transketolase [Deltaproteobacteria bacterium]
MGASPLPRMGPAELEDKAAALRRLLIDVAHRTGGAYLAQALSGIDMMTAVHYGFADGDAAHPDRPDRDRFLLSPGHYALALYAVLADRGYFDRDLLWTFKDDGSPLELASHRGTVPGVEASGGSLGQVLSVGVGMALHARLRAKAHRVFVFMSDGEQDEGQIWEAAASAAHYRLSNLVAVIDANGFQVDGPTREVMDMEPLGDKYRAFGWDVVECDGNDMTAVAAGLGRLCAPAATRPGMLVGRTVRGKGVSFMEGNPAFHYARLDGSQRDRAVADLSGDTDAV